MKNRLKKLTAALLGVLLLTGCQGNIDGNKEIKSYSLAQSMIIVATERNRYEAAFTGEIWDVTLENGSTFDTYLLTQVKTFLQNMKTMTLLANDQEISLTSAEKTQIRSLAETYYEGLTEDDISYMGIRLDDVITMYQEYYLTNKVVHELTRELDLEVSDSEAKVITIQQMELTDPDTAATVLEKAMAEGADFDAIAREYTGGNARQRQLARDDEESSFEQAAFALAAGEISPVVISDGKYYILRCVSDYDEAATAERKTWLYKERKNQVFKQIYNQFQASRPLDFSDEVWDDIALNPQKLSTTTNFFDLYQEEFGSQSY